MSINFKELLKLVVRRFICINVGELEQSHVDIHDHEHCEPVFHPGLPLAFRLPGFTDL
jgi:hypothetical protein